MKNLKVLGMIGLGCGMLFLTGCGDAHTLKCERSEDGQSVSVEVKYNSDETKPEKVSMEMVYDAGDEATSEQLEQAKELFESSMCTDDYDKCSVNIKGKTLVINVSGTAEKLDFPEGSMADAKKQAEEEGYTCK